MSSSPVIPQRQTRSVRQIHKHLQDTRNQCTQRQKRNPGAFEKLLLEEASKPVSPEWPGSPSNHPPTKLQPPPPAQAKREGADQKTRPKRKASLEAQQPQSPKNPPPKPHRLKRSKIFENKKSRQKRVANDGGGKRPPGNQEQEEGRRIEESRRSRLESKKEKGKGVRDGRGCGETEEGGEVPGPKPQNQRQGESLQEHHLEDAAKLYLPLAQPDLSKPGLLERRRCLPSLPLFAGRHLFFFFCSISKEFYRREKNIQGYKGYAPGLTFLEDRVETQETYHTTRGSLGWPK